MKRVTRANENRGDNEGSESSTRVYCFPCGQHARVPMLYVHGCRTKTAPHSLMLSVRCCCTCSTFCGCCCIAGWCSCCCDWPAQPAPALNFIAGCGSRSARMSQTLPPGTCVCAVNVGGRLCQQVGGSMGARSASAALKSAAELPPV